MKTKSVNLMSLIVVLSLNTAFGASPFCVAHRSLGYGGLENSLEAFENASKANASAIEFDLIHTKDSKTVVHHDKKFKRVATGANCPKDIAVAELSLQEIQSDCRLNNGEAISTLEDALIVLSKYDSILFIEFKDKIITEEDFAIIKKYYSHRPEKIMIISFMENILKAVEDKRATDDFYKQVKTLQLKKFGFIGNIDDFGGISAKYITKNRVGSLQGKGKLVGVYTKDSEKEMKKYLDKNVDFITTNESQLCESLIK